MTYKEVYQLRKKAGDNASYWDLPKYEGQAYRPTRIRYNPQLSYEENWVRYRNNFQQNMMRKNRGYRDAQIVRRQLLPSQDNQALPYEGLGKTMFGAVDRLPERFWGPINMFKYKQASPQQFIPQLKKGYDNWRKNQLARIDKAKAAFRQPSFTEKLRTKTNSILNNGREYINKLKNRIWTQQ